MMVRKGCVGGDKEEWEGVSEVGDDQDKLGRCMKLSKIKSFRRQKIIKISPLLYLH